MEDEAREGGEGGERELLALIRLKIRLPVNYFYVAIVITLKGGYNVIHRSNKIGFFYIIV